MVPRVLPKWFEPAAFIDGDWVKSTQVFPVVNPANGQEIVRLPDLGAVETERAVRAADKAFAEWSVRPAKARAQILLRWFQLIVEHGEELARLMTAEQGKPLAEARGEVAYGASFIEWFAEEGKRAYGRTIPTVAENKRYLTIKQPVGVCAAITPWNFPIAMITRKAGPALAAGCTMVLKPSEETPLSALALAKLAEMAGVPPGVLNVITSTDAASIGEILCRDPRVAKLSFTGSTAIGKLLYRQCSDTVKRLSLELGGNAPLIIFDDANLDEAVTGTLVSKYRNAGQTCVCANRILVQDGIYDRFVAALTEKVRAMTVGPGDHEGVTIGPLINQKAATKVTALVNQALSQGARLLVGGETTNLFVTPSIVVDITPDMSIANEEIFGPVASITRFAREDTAIALANATDSGLAAYLFSRDIGRVWRVSERLQVGMVSVNEGVFSSEVAPFGGVKQSGIGREGAAEGLDEYLTTKMICLGNI
jgi:succinate-semialdehyde dehydrogenase/glutarate-semialdehyde dehydrogenase